MGEARGEEFETKDPGEFVHRLKSVTPTFHAHPTKSQFHAKVHIAPIERWGLFVSRVEHGDVAVEPLRDMVSINIPLAAGIEGRCGLRFDALEPGSMAIGVPGEPLDLRFRVAAPLLVANFSVALFQKAIDEPSHGASEFRKLPPWSAEAAQVFRTLSACWREAIRGGGPEHLEEERDAVVEEIATALIASAPFHDRSCWDAKRIVALGIDFIHHELARPLTVADIARAARTSPRTLHRAFVDQIGISPMGYVRRERLHALRRFLLQAEPGEITVSEAARKYGFRHLGRLSTLYRNAFRESPSETLLR